MSNGIANIDMGLMMDVIALLPRVEQGEAEESRQDFTDAVNGYVGPVPFGRGDEGDGTVYVTCDWSSVYDDKVNTTLTIDEEGWLINADIGFEERIPFRVARYFMATIFGLEELTPLAQKHFYVEKEKASDPKGAEDGFVPEPTPAYVPQLLKGARLLYECAELEGGLGSCGESEGMKIIESVKESIVGDGDEQP